MDALYLVKEIFLSIFLLFQHKSCRRFIAIAILLLSLITFQCARVNETGLYLDERGSDGITFSHFYLFIHWINFSISAGKGVRRSHGMCRLNISTQFKALTPYV